MNDYHALLAQAYAPRPPTRWLPWLTIVVGEHESALLYRNGRLVGPLAAGLHRRWGRHLKVVRFDHRRQLLEIPAQELPTADGITIKVTAQVTWQIVDPLALVAGNVDHCQALYAAAQQAVREAVSAQSLAQLIAGRAAVAAAMQTALAAACGANGIAIRAAAIKDLMPNAETRRAMAAVAFAKQEALASLEKARGEQASLRALANAARLLAEQPALARLKGLQILAEGLRGGASLVVNAGDAGLVPVKERV